jgi:hypothetical protein
MAQVVEKEKELREHILHYVTWLQLQKLKYDFKKEQEEPGSGGSCL